MYGQPQNPETIEGLSPTCRGAVGGIDADGWLSRSPRRQLEAQRQPFYAHSQLSDSTVS